MLKLNKEKEFNYYINNINFSLIVIFYTNWCSFCYDLEKKINKLILRNKKLKFLGIDAEKFPNLSNYYKIYSVPVIIFFHNGNEIKRKINSFDFDELNNFITF